MIDTKVLRERGEFLSSGSAKDAFDAADEIDRLRAELATARTLAMNDASLAIRDSGIEFRADHFGETNLRNQRSASQRAVLALAPMPQGLVAVPVETLEMFGRALDSAQGDCCDGDGPDEAPTHEGKCKIGRALDALSSLLPKEKP